MSERPVKKKTSKLKAAAKGSSGEESRGGPGDPMDTRFVEQLAKLMASNDLNTVELRDGDRRVMLRRGPAEVVSYGAPQAAAPAPASSAPAGAAAPAVSDANDESKLLKITSPMPGTFYVAAKQGDKPFVTVGSAVDDDTDVCIIEAMKVFNVHKAECRGTIARIVAEDGKPVEFGSVLFLVKPR